MKILYPLIALLLINIKLLAGDNITVSTVSPSAQSISSLPTLDIEINFSSAVDINSFNSTTFQVWGRWSGVHTGSIAVTNDTTTITFNPDNNFFYGEQVTVSLSKGIQDMQGNYLQTGFAWSFWTKVLPGSMSLTRTETINVRQTGEGWVQTYGTYAGDLDGDGWSDFIVPNENPADIRVFMNDQQGSYDDFTVFDINGGSRPSTNEGFDYNLDGLMDFVVGNSNNDQVTVFTGDGTGSFSSTQNYKAAGGIRGLVVLDIDGDGYPDIVTSNRQGNNVSIIMNNGDGTFSSPNNFEGNGNGETAAAMADVNADGIMDVFIGSIYSDEIILWLGDGNGNLSFHDDITVGSSPWMIVSGDVNNDGIPDVVSANSNGPSFSIVLCNASGNLVSSTNYPVGSFPISIDLGDVDGDLDLDIVTSNFSGGNFTMYENNGTGVFINRNDFPSNQAGSCAVFHDRDNDGDMDMTGIDELQDLLILFTNSGVTAINNPEIIPEDFILNQNYPNPFNPGTKISWQSPVSGQQTLKVYDVLGNEVALLIDEYKSAGSYEVEWNASSLPSGMYFYTLKAGNYSETKKMVLLK
ncbi:MAG: FG-GAP-like repeat-containing protein [Ignavibacteriales bacterium]